MALLLRNITQVYSSSSATNVSINKPTGTAEGDLMLIFIGELGGNDSDEEPSAVDAPAGWKPVVTLQNLSNIDVAGDPTLPSHQVYMKKAGSSEPSSYTFALVSNPLVANQTYCMCSFYNTASTSGYWEMTDSGTNKTSSGTALTTNTLSGGGLYITSFMTTAIGTTISSTNSPGTSASFQNTDVSMAIYQGESAALTNSTTLTFANTGLIYCASLMFKYISSIPSVPTNILERARSTASSGLQIGSSTTINFSKPTGTVEGDLMVMCFGLSYVFTVPGWTWPTGWTLVYDLTSRPSGYEGSTNLVFPFMTMVIYKVAGASEPSSYPITLSSFAGYAWADGSLSSWYNSGGVGGWNLIRKNITNSILSSEYISGSGVKANYARSLGFGGKGLWITPVLAVNQLNDTDSGVLPITSQQDIDGNSVTFLQTQFTANVFKNNFTVFAQADSFDFNSINIEYGTYDGNEEDNVQSVSVPMMFESTVSPGPTTYISKIKIGNTYKNITAGFVATSSGWKEIEAGLIAEGTRYNSADSWKEVFKKQ